MVAPGGGAGASPLLVGVGGTGVGIGAGVPEPEVEVLVEPDELVEPVLEPPATGVVDEDETPDELPDELPLEPVNCVVVVPGDLVRAFVPPHPVTQNAAILRAAMAQIPFRFNRIH